MKDPLFLALEEVLALHDDQIRRYGGSLGIRDANLLSSALAMPESSFGGEFLHPTLHEMAAAYHFHLTQNHPFVDGNKRIGLAAALLFLGLNDVTVDVDDDRLTELVLGLARGQVTKAAIAEFLRAHARDASP